MRYLMCLAAALVSAAAGAAAQAGSRQTAADQVRSLTRSSAWELMAAIPLTFDAHHPQGMARVGDALFVSSVEVTVPTRRLPEPAGGYDRDPGAGVGHLFKIDLKGQLVARTRLGEGTIYHPGGIDYDGRHIWVPVAEYRPRSRSIVYRVDPTTLEAAEVFRVADHIGGLVHNTDDGSLHGVSWGSRVFYRWAPGAGGTIAPDHAGQRPNPAHYIDYQDCKYAGGFRMLCTGLAEIRQPDGPALRLGGIELVDLRDGRPLHQVPVPLWTSSGLPMTRNPVWLEAVPARLRAYFLPEDGRSTLYIYEAAAIGSR